jgi:hypothetical protein
MTDERGTGKITKGSCDYFSFTEEACGVSGFYKETVMKRSGESHGVNFLGMFRLASVMLLLKHVR